MKMIKKIKNRIKSSIEIAPLGINIFYKFKIFFIYWWILIKKKLDMSQQVESRLKLKKFGRVFYFYATSSTDFTSLKEIFIDDEYQFNLKEHPNIIFDLGSNIGLSVIYFKLKYPKAKIYAFEPDPDTYKKLKKNLKQFDNIFIFNLAISDKNEKEKFYSNPKRNASSSFFMRLPNQSYVEVDSKTLDTILQELSIAFIDFLKFDIEGAESRVFKNFKNLNRVRNIIGEIHLDLINESKEQFLNYFNYFLIDSEQISSKRYLIKASKKNNHSN